MTKSCIGPSGEDVCHLAKGPPTVNFMVDMAQKRREIKKTKKESEDPRVQVALQALDQPTKKKDPTPTPTERERDRKSVMRVSKMRPNTDVLSLAEIDKARMVRVSKTFYKDGANAAQLELDAGLSESWVIDRALSSTEGLVLTRNGEVKIAYRGTDFKNTRDLLTDALVLGGVEEVPFLQKLSQINESRAQIRSVFEKYGRMPSELLGYSNHSLAGRGNMLTSLGDWNDGKAIFPLQLCMPGQPINVRVGYNSRGNNTQFSISITNQTMETLDLPSQRTASISTLVIAETSSEMRISGGRQVAIAT